MTPRTENAPPEGKLVERNRSCNSMLLTEVDLQSEKDNENNRRKRNDTCGHHYREPNVQLHQIAVH